MTLEGRLDATESADGVRFDFTVTNTSDEPVTLRFSDACTADVAVRDDGREVWRFSDGRMFAQVITEETIGPGESETFDVEWPDPESGEYTAEAELCAQQRVCQARTDVSI